MKGQSSTDELPVNSLVALQLILYSGLHCKDAFGSDIEPSNLGVSTDVGVLLQ